MLRDTTTRDVNVPRWIAFTSLYHEFALMVPHAGGHKYDAALPSLRDRNDSDYHQVGISPDSPTGKSMRRSQRLLARRGSRRVFIISVLCSLSFLALGFNAGNVGLVHATEPTRPYSEAVVEKADAILKKAGLRRSGSSLQSTEASDLARVISSLSRKRRELRQVQNELAAVQAAIDQMDKMLARLNLTDGELNLQLTQIAGDDVIASNRIVAMINATRSQITETRRVRAEKVELLRKNRAIVNSEEASYAEQVFQIRKQIDAAGEKLKAQMQIGDVKIAIDVMNHNFDVPKEITVSEILRSISNRLASFESDVFQESIPLEVGPSGSLTVMASLNNQPLSMVVDSGATVVTLPANTAIELKITIPGDASPVTLSLANGARIQGKRIFLDSLRVGQFEAKQVEAVVLEPIAGGVQPLLGLSFLDRYRFELDSNAKTLNLLEVADSDSKGR
ncbi:clan AA aspartic protease, TIGR02281 family [Neorhodopirellula lusitana]|uniref:Clan AA aspartic protease, TIGR02281 family n=1 Tax=Neorhodopirellula lusitana TaxID=445327 RepID=A0ABY1QK39_9BACT|nr:TIGR02281 family clan AA aspartic protease [Neorhodopirellula lusitana]SMP73980.1 clan AA aspartic protease, TIGR02281 family [Neorhodopirellula lusitana]